MQRIVTRLLTALLLASVLSACSLVMPAAVDVGVKEVISQDVDTELSPDLTVSEVSQVIKEMDVAIIDVREEYEYNEGHIEGAALLPLGEIPDRIDEIPKDVPVILVCRSGNRSGQAYQYLTEQGFDNVHNMLGGMLDWAAYGYAIEK